MAFKAKHRISQELQTKTITIDDCTFEIRKYNYALFLKMSTHYTFRQDLLRKVVNEKEERKKWYIETKGYSEELAEQRALVDYDEKLLDATRKLFESKCEILKYGLVGHSKGAILDMDGKEVEFKSVKEIVDNVPLQVMSQETINAYIEVGEPLFNELIDRLSEEIIMYSQEGVSKEEIENPLSEGEQLALKL